MNEYLKNCILLDFFWGEGSWSIKSENSAFFLPWTQSEWYSQNFFIQWFLKTQDEKKKKKPQDEVRSDEVRGNRQLVNEVS